MPLFGTDSPNFKFCITMYFEIWSKDIINNVSIRKYELRKFFVNIVCFLFLICELYFNY